MQLLTHEEYFTRANQMTFNMIANNETHLLKRFAPVVELLQSEDYTLALCLAEINGWAQDLLDEMRLTFNILKVS
jgi:hypothetical protein